MHDEDSRDEMPWMTRKGYIGCLIAVVVVPVVLVLMYFVGVYLFLIGLGNPR